MLSRIAVYYGGAYPVSELMNLRYKDLKFWHDLMIREKVEDNILHDLAGKKKQVPSSRSLRRMVDKKIREFRDNGRQ